MIIHYFYFCLTSNFILINVPSLDAIIIDLSSSPKQQILGASGPLYHAKLHSELKYPPKIFKFDVLFFLISSSEDSEFIIKTCIVPVSEEEHKNFESFENASEYIVALSFPLLSSCIFFFFHLKYPKF